MEVLDESLPTLVSSSGICRRSDDLDIFRFFGGAGAHICLLIRVTENLMFKKGGN